MMEQEFEDLVNAVSESFGMNKSEILRKFSHRTSRARYFMCHIIYNSLPHLRRTILEKSDISGAAYNKAVNHAEEIIQESPECLHIMNEIRSKIGLPSLKYTEEINNRPSNTMALFGFDYTEEENRQRRMAIEESVRWFNKEYGSYGVKPLKEGCVYSR